MKSELKSDLGMALFAAFIITIGQCKSPNYTDVKFKPILTDSVPGDTLKTTMDSIEKAYNDSMFPAILKPDSL